MVGQLVLVRGHKSDELLLLTPVQPGDGRQVGKLFICEDMRTRRHNGVDVRASIISTVSSKSSGLPLSKNHSAHGKLRV